MENKMIAATITPDIMQDAHMKRYTVITGRARCWSYTDLACIHIFKDRAMENYYVFLQSISPLKIKSVLYDWMLTVLIQFQISCIPLWVTEGQAAIVIFMCIFLICTL
jgi:hypothetical protein